MEYSQYPANDPAVDLLRPGDRKHLLHGAAAPRMPKRSVLPYRLCFQAAYFVPPTVFVDVPTDAPVWREEIFGARERTHERPYHRRAPQGTPVAMRCGHAAWDIRCRSRAGPVL
jgi:hypothetical protein